MVFSQRTDFCAPCMCMCVRIKVRNCTIKQYCVVCITLHSRYNALQYNADSVITRLRSWTPIFQVGLVSG